MRWAWPVWGGLCAVIGGILIVFIIAICFIPCSARHNRPAGVALLPAEVFRDQGDLQAQSWANTTVAAIQNVAETPLAPELPAKPDEEEGNAHGGANTGSRSFESDNHGGPALNDPDSIPAEEPIEVIEMADQLMTT
ncbi:hypothetical protein DL93DRAFT_2088959 [Clavulina sp. PMI_390]|nr:hypothetical protein DL93DRAFT_2088959 [Clavulina sp. PMI_390]